MVTAKPQSPRRSTLIVPVHKPKFVDKCWLRNADAITLDLEDGVLPSEKDFARTQVREAIRIAARGGADIFVRINSERETFYADIEASMHPGLTGILLTKVESPWDVKEVETIITDLEAERGFAPGSVVLHTSIETAKGFVFLKDILSAGRRLVSANIGMEDFSRDIGIELVEGDELAVPAFLLVITAKAYGLMPTGLVASIADFQNKEHFRKVIKNSVKIGLKGASGIHPDQIPILNEGFSPPKDQVELARRVVDIFEESKRKGDGAIALDGRMIDKPMVDRALNLLARQTAIDEFQAYKDAMVAKNKGGNG